MNLQGVDVEGIRSELGTYVEQTTPRNASSGTFITTKCLAACGRPRAIVLSERILPILERLSPRWRDENEADRDFEFGQMRDASQRLLARIDSSDEIAKMLEGHDASPCLSAGEMHTLVWRAASAQWATGHRHEAVLAAAKAVNSRLQEKLDRRDLSEAKLVQEALSEKPAEPGRPRLRFGSIEDEQTRESMRRGVMGFGAGCFQAIRNPVGPPER